jgi:hypothetical protein
MKNLSQLPVKTSKRLMSYKESFIKMAYRCGLNQVEIATIFGTTKQNNSKEKII